MRSLRIGICVLFCVCLLCTLPTFATDDEMHQHHHDANEQLGKVSFPTSCSPGSQKSFERGVALLHSFGYEEAEEQFAEVAKQDSTCAMPHWGIAMSQFHQIWERPDEAAMKKGAEEIAEAQKIGTKTDRERQYVSALALFYQEPAKNDYMKRVTAYSDAMGKLYQQYPNDIEAGAFFALSLLAAAPPSDSTHASEKKAVAVLNTLFQQQPDHPGLAHYIIHACDSPDMAPLGLDAARRYATIAPSSAHAVHMPSHIFARVGLWQDDIQSNLKSVSLARSSTMGFMHGHELHAMHFLTYAYLQTGQDEAAKQEVEAARQIIASIPKDSGDSGMLYYYGFADAHFPALYQLEMHHWAEAAALEPSTGEAPQFRMITYWARTIGSAHLGDVEATRLNAQKYDEAVEATRKSKYGYTLEGPNSSTGEVHAWLAFAEKKNDDALHQIRQVADMQDKVGKREVDIPAREMLADMLLQMNRPQEAMAEYVSTMEIDPNRFNSLAGAARAAELSHQTEKANSYYVQLLKNCDDGKHSDRPELQRAKTLVAKN